MKLNLRKTNQVTGFIWQLSHCTNPSVLPYSNCVQTHGPLKSAGIV